MRAGNVGLRTTQKEDVTLPLPSLGFLVSYNAFPRF